MATIGHVWVSILITRMKKIFSLWICCLLLNAVGTGQTIHSDGAEILYMDTIHSNGVSDDELFIRSQQLFSELKHDKKIDEKKLRITGHKLHARMSVKLPTINHASKKFEFDLEISTSPGVYQYRIDSVVIVRKEPGDKANKQSAKELLKGMGSSGSIAISTEKDLNEIDMHIQKILDELNTEMKKPHSDPGE